MDNRNEKDNQSEHDGLVLFEPDIRTKTMVNESIPDSGRMFGPPNLGSRQSSNCEPIVRGNLSSLPSCPSHG